MQKSKSNGNEKGEIEIYFGSVIDFCQPNIKVSTVKYASQRDSLSVERRQLKNIIIEKSIYTSVKLIFWNVFYPGCEQDVHEEYLSCVFIKINYTN